jgi:hypothetical protein
MKAVKTSIMMLVGKFEMSNMAYIARAQYKNIKDVEDIAIKIIIRFQREEISVLFKWVGFTSGDFDANGEGEVGRNCGDALR